MLLDLIEGAADGQRAAIEDVGVNHGRFHILVPKQFLHRADIVAVFKEMSSKAVAEGVSGDTLVEAGESGRVFDRLLQAALVHMVAAHAPGTRVSG